MSVLIISPYFHQETAARAIQVRKLYEGLTESPVRFFLATLNDSTLEAKASKNVVPLRENQSWQDRLYDGPVTANISYLANFVEKNNITTILTISTPVFSAYIGLFLKKKLSYLKWISYFSDPMPASVFPEPYFTGYSSFTNRLKAGYQKFRMSQVLDLADGIIMPSSKTLEYYETVYNKSLAHKTNVIPHMGGTLHNDEPLPVHDELKNRLVYFGDLYKRLSVPMIEAVKKVKNDDSDSFGGLVCFGTHHTKEFEEFLEKNNAKDIVELKTSVPYQESLKLMRQSDVLLLIEADMEASPFMPSKYFDYLFANRPILAVAPHQNSLNEHYKQSGDFLIAGHNTDDISKAIKSLFNQPRNITKRDLAHLERDAIIQQYSKVLNA